MAFFLLRPRSILFVTALSIPVIASGACGSRTACIAYTQAEYTANNGSCLAPHDALAAFTSPDCPGSIVSVDGPGTFDGEICCYPVTYDSVDQSCGSTNGQGASPPGFGGDTTFTMPTTTTFTTTPSSCPSCSEALVEGGMPCFPPSSDNYTALQNCAGCNSVPGDAGTPCLGLCASLCISDHGPLPEDCLSCLQTGCPGAWAACQGS